MSSRMYGVIALGTHPDNLEVAVGGTMAKFGRKGLSVLSVDLCDGEPSRHGIRGERHAQAVKAAEILGVERSTLTLNERLSALWTRRRSQDAKLLRTVDDYRECRRRSTSRMSPQACLISENAKAQ